MQCTLLIFLRVRLSARPARGAITVFDYLVLLSSADGRFCDLHCHCCLRIERPFALGGPCEYFLQIDRATRRPLQHLQLDIAQMLRHQVAGFRCIAGIERGKNVFVILE